MRRLVGGLTIALAASACVSSDGVTPGGAPDPPTIPSSTGSLPTGQGAASTTTSSSTTTTTTPVVACPSPLRDLPAGPDDALPLVGRIPGDDPVAASISISLSTYRCAEVAVVADAADVEAVAAAARLAAHAGGPLLLGTAAGDPALDAELERLAPLLVYRIGSTVPLGVPDGTALETVAAGEAPEGTLPDLAPATTTTTTSPTTTTTTAASTTTMPGAATTAPGGENGAGESGGGAEGEGTSDLPPVAEPAAADPPTAATGLVVGDGSSGMLWLVGDRDYPLAAAAAAAAAVSGGMMAVVDAADLRAVPEVVGAVRASVREPVAVDVVGAVTEDAEWQVPILLEAPEVPGGGLLLFAGRRMVAFYGNPLTPVLGVLGEQDPEATVERLAAVATPYGADGAEVLPAFELIATVADSREGSDGNFSNEMDLDVLRPWIETAAERGLYVLLDLQPGRTDFLTQARIYEEFLRLPHVGLALDPEWRLGPDQFHLRQFGSVSAEEVNEVAAWLAELVREERLPQKMLLLHQFRLSMLRDRDLIEKPAELAVVIQMDGQGPIETKYETWSAITAGTGDGGWLWGWKNFYDEDTPTATAEEVLQLQPTVVYVSYQ